MTVRVWLVPLGIGVAWALIAGCSPTYRERDLVGDWNFVGATTNTATAEVRFLENRTAIMKIMTATGRGTTQDYQWALDGDKLRLTQKGVGAIPDISVILKLNRSELAVSAGDGSVKKFKRVSASRAN